ncbi:MAG: LysR family transcriptional regulator [Proteobacteria bacterium]|nr:LysR family transcriptional regulator [Pseudomonadota bacterium]
MLKSTLTQWQIFTKVVEERGYLKAAEALNRSHSSVHHAISKLETQLGERLVYVQDRQLHLTALGRVMHRRAKQLLADAEDMEAMVEFSAQGWETDLTIAVENLYPRRQLTRALEQFYGDDLNIRLKINTVVLNGAVNAITEGKADIVISPIIPPGYVGTPLTTVKMVPLASYFHPLVTAGRLVETRELSRHLQIVISDGLEPDKQPDLGWLKSEQRWSVADFQHARDIMISGMGFCWMPEYMFHDDIEHGILEIVPTRDKLERLVTLNMILPRADSTGPAARLLADKIQQHSLAVIPEEERV